MSDLKISISIDAKDTKSGADEAKRAVRGVGDEAEKTGRRVQSLTKIDFSGAIRQIKEYGSQIQNLGQRLSSYGQTLALTLSAPIAALAALGIKFNATKEQSITAFRVLLKDGEAAKKLYSELQDFADATPFQTPEVVESGRKLLAAKVPLEEIKGYLTDIGDLAAGTGQNITEVASAFTRIKAGDFGEAFERLRDFGIARKDLEAQGLKFDKSGQYLGSVEQAMAAVRAIVQRDFGGMMQEQSKTFTGRISTILDTLNRSLGDLFEPLFEKIREGLPVVIDFVTNLKEFLSGLSEPAKIAITIFLGIAAAIGPILIVLGTLISSVGSLVPVFASVGGAVAAFGSVFLGIGGFIVSFIGLIGQAGLVASFTGLATVVGSTVVGAIGSFLTALAPVVIGVAAVVAVVGTLIAVGVALYAAYQTNFGGLRDLVNEAFNFIVDTIQSGLAAVVGFWATYGGQILETATTIFNSVVEFLRPIMTQIVSTVREGFQTIVEVAGPLMTQVFTFVKNNLTATIIIVRTVLAGISAFWQAHGEQIKNIVSAAWNIVKTVVLATIRQIANIITLVLALINGDWRGAWNAFKQIISTAVNAAISIFKSLGTIIINSLKFIATVVYNIGKNIVEGLVNGIKSGAAAVYETVSGIANKVIGTFRSVPEVRSPSRVTTRIGEFITQGLAIGIQNKESLAVNAAKKVASEVIKAFKDAQKEFGKLAGASPKTIRTIQETTRTSDAASAQQEIIKLRGELDVNQDRSLPRTVAETEKELQFLRQFKENQDAYNQSVAEANELIVEQAVAYRLKLEDMREAGEQEMLRLQEEIRLLGVTDETERLRIQNHYEIQTLREQMRNDGFGKDQIDEAAQVLKIEQARKSELQDILKVKKQILAANDLGEDLSGKLLDLQNGGRELSEYEKTLQKINTDLKDIAPAQKEYLLNLAQQIDAQKAYNEQYQQTYDFIRGSLDVLTDSSKTVGEKLKSIFGGILQSFKKMLLDMVAAYLTSKVMKLFGFDGGGSSGGGSGFGGIFDKIKTLFNGGGSSSGSSGGTAPFNPNNPFAGIGGASSGGSSSAGTSPGSFGLGGGIAIAGTAANIIGGLIGGRAGSFISNIGSGAALGASIGSIVPGVGTLIGAGVGAVGGFIASLFGGDPKRKRDKNEKLPQLQKGFTDALAQLRALGADKNAFYNDPEATIAKAVELRGQIASGFGLQFESKKYQKQAQGLIAQKLTEADTIITDLQRLKNRAVQARDIDSRLQTSFATGVYLRDDQMGEMQRALDFKRRNGMLAGNFTGIDNLPSLLAQGEMVLNPMQIQQVILNSGGDDPFRDAGIPGYSTGAYIAPSPSAQPAAAPVAASSSAPNITIEKISVVLEGEGISNVKVKEILIDNLKKSDVQVEVVNAYDKGKARTK